MGAEQGQSSVELAGDPFSGGAGHHMSSASSAASMDNYLFNQSQSQAFHHLAEEVGGADTGQQNQQGQDAEHAELMRVLAKGRDVPDEERLRDMNYLDAMSEFPIGQKFLQSSTGSKLNRTVDPEIEAQGQRLKEEKKNKKTD